jgi:hypothetical protein
MRVTAFYYPRSWSMPLFEKEGLGEISLPSATSTRRRSLHRRSNELKIAASLTLLSTLHIPQITKFRGSHLL